ncbi:hypothetical protein DSO57_1026511 [Entomophthora muscae]|uniref:Uncharacterized protein n=1 Tax=Entomophthora muscae TaxID=34485 RepID=A0ACC2RSY1_9FUNG|nr:hypothetical protein DSO57_1026511 [Entomophthora muscae]
MACPMSEGIPFLATSDVTVPPGSQDILDSQILYELPERTFLELYSPPLLGRNKPYLCPGIWDISHKDTVQMLVANLTALPINVSRGQAVDYDKLLNAPDVLSLHPFGTFQDFNLPEDEPQILYLFTVQDFLQLSPVQHKEVLNLIVQFSDIFAKDSNNYGLAKGVIHQIDTGDCCVLRRGTDTQQEILTLGLDLY